MLTFSGQNLTVLLFVRKEIREKESNDRISKFRNQSCRLRSFLAFRAVIPTTSKVMHPPNTTDGTTPNNLAASPDSNESISFEEVRRMLITVETRPFMYSGVKV